ncbi:MAG: HlyD family efflux transporter periplasmic adaptor subunit, partial [Candidatus Hydrogenedentes bacterium]|nr:HlyD family efflux transporter periplasmic adaptor subunit [Candidatus Hydrogenedentota bacterium]
RRVLVAGTPILKLGDLATIEIESDVLSEEVGRIEVGSHVELVGKALGGEEAAGTVKRIYPAAFTKVSSLGIQQQRVKVIVAFDNNVPRLRVGTRLDVRIITAERTNTLAVPERSTFRREGEWYVFTVNNGQAHLTPVKIGLKNDEWAELVEGLETDTRIVLEPKNEMVDGVRVQSKTRKE